MFKNLVIIRKHKSNWESEFFWCFMDNATPAGDVMYMVLVGSLICQHLFLSVT